MSINLNTSAGILGESEPIVSETVFDSAALKRGRGRPRKVQPEESVEVKNPVDVGSLSEILKRGRGMITESDSYQKREMRKEIKIVIESKSLLFEEKVNILLNSHAGWVLLGTPFNSNGNLVQALYREEIV